MKLCLQSLIFLIISTLTVLGSFLLKGKMEAIFSEIMVIFIITYILNWLCKKNYKILSWILMFIPTFAYLFLLLIMGAVVFNKM